MLVEVHRVLIAIRLITVAIVVGIVLTLINWTLRVVLIWQVTLAVVIGHLATALLEKKWHIVTRIIVSIVA